MIVLVVVVKVGVMQGFLRAFLLVKQSWYGLVLNNAAGDATLRICDAESRCFGS